jgi:hypothetical protein
MTEKPYKFVVRLPDNMRERIAEAALTYHRSMNSEIVARLEQSFSALPDGEARSTLEPPLHPQIEQMFRRTLTEQEEQIIRGFRSLTKLKQAALLELLS